MDDSNVVKVMTLGFNELCVVYICWGQVTDVVISPFSSLFSTACNSHAEGEKAWKWCTAAHHRWRSLFSSSLLLAVIWTAVFAAPLLYLRNYQLPPKGRRVSCYPQCDLRDGKDGDKRCAFWCSSLVSWGKTQPIHRARKVMGTQMLGSCFLSCESHIFTQWCVPWRAAQLLCTR